MGNLSIQYHDIALGALQKSTSETLNANKLSDVDYFSAGILRTRKFATFEPNYWVLDGKMDTYYVRPAFISDFRSEDDGYFAKEKRPSLIFNLDKPYVAPGFTLSFGSFEPDLGDFCSDVRLSMYRDGKKIDGGVYYPNSSEYFCKWKNPAPFDKVKIEFRKTSIPKRYARLNSVAFGAVRKFGRDEVRGATLQVEGNLIGDKVSTSSLNWTLNNLEPLDFSFRTLQPVYTYDGDKLLSVTYVKKAEQTGDKLYKIDCEDLIGLLDRSTVPAKKFDGRLNSQGYLYQLLGGDYEITLDQDLQDIPVNGFIKSCSRREALQQLCFVLGACATTFRSDGLRVKNVFGALPVFIPSLDPDDVFSGQKFTENEIVSSVTVVSHNLVPDADGDIEIAGQKYKDETREHTKVNSDPKAQARGKAYKVDNMTLVTLSNVDKVLDTTYNYLMQRGEMSAKIVLGDHDIGETVEIPTIWNENTVGAISSMNVKLSNMTVADIKTVVKN